MLRQPNQRLLLIGLYANAILLAGVLVVLLSRSSLPTFLPAAYAQTQAPIGGGAGVFIVPAQFSPNTFGCYLLDIDSQTICAYQFFPGEPQLKLRAARNFRYDRRLGHFNTVDPSPEEVRTLVEQETQSNRVQGANAPRPSPEAPQKQE
jgi:hypothetical protein